MTGAEKVADFLAARGLKTAFGIIGAGNVALYDAFARRGSTQIVANHHEQASVMAATAYARVTGEVGVAVVTTGAGSSNALTGVLAAFMDSIPLVVLAGNEATSRHHVSRARGVQGYDSVAVAVPMTKLAIRLRYASQVKMALDMAFERALAGRPGPVWVELPMDVMGAAA